MCAVQACITLRTSIVVSIFAVSTLLTVSCQDGFIMLEDEYV